MRGDTIDIDRYVQHCRDTETQSQRWVRYVIHQPDSESRLLGQFPVVKISEGHGVTTYAYHSGGGVHTMTTERWNTLPRRH